MGGKFLEINQIRIVQKMIFWMLLIYLISRVFYLIVSNIVLADSLVLLRSLFTFACKK